jgi:hypothetical protein
MLSRAEELFARFEGDPDATLDDLLADRTNEQLFLDYKRSADNGRTKRGLDPADNANFSKAASGFANSEGGVLIWGIGEDKVTKGPIKMPLVDVDNFRECLEKATSRVTVPSHPGIRHHHWKSDSQGSGFAVTLIPKTTLGPVRSTVFENYFLRSGESHSVIPHDALAGLFGRPPIGRIDWLHQSNAIQDEALGSPKVLVRLGVILVNVGVTIAEELYITAFPTQVSPPTQFRLAEADTNRIEAYSTRIGPANSYQLIVKDPVRLAPRAHFYICDVNLVVSRERPEDVAIDCIAGCKGGEPRHFTLRASGLQFAQAFQRMKEGWQEQSGNLLLSHYQKH